MARFVRGPERVLAETSFLRLVEGDFTMPDGAVVQRLVIRHPGAVVVVPIIDDDVILVRQYRAAIDRELLELPAGKCDVEGEALEVTAERELIEEIGYRPGCLEKLTQVLTTPGFCDEVLHVFVAHDLEPVDRNAQSHEEAHMTIERWPIEDAIAAVRSGEIEDAKTIVGLLMVSPAQ